MRTTTPATIQRHALPGEAGGDTAWFHRQNGFEQQETFRQVAFKRNRWPHLPDGQSSQRPTCTYPHILPAGHERLAFYELWRDQPVLFGRKELRSAFRCADLKSSQAACLDLRNV